VNLLSHFLNCRSVIVVKLPQYVQTSYCTNTFLYHYIVKLYLWGRYWNWNQFIGLLPLQNWQRFCLLNSNISRPVKSVYQAVVYTLRLFWYTHALWCIHLNHIFTWF